MKDKKLVQDIRDHSGDKAEITDIMRVEYDTVRYEIKCPWGRSSGLAKHLQKRGWAAARVGLRTVAVWKRG